MSGSKKPMITVLSRRVDQPFPSCQITPPCPYNWLRFLLLAPSNLRITPAILRLRVHPPRQMFGRQPCPSRLRRTRTSAIAFPQRSNALPSQTSPPKISRVSSVLSAALSVSIAPVSTPTAHTRVNTAPSPLAMQPSNSPGS